MSTKTEMRQGRDNEMLDMLNEALVLFMDKNTTDPRTKAMEFTLANGHPRYWVSFDRAYEVVTSILLRGHNPVTTTQQAQMWEEIARKTRQAMDCGAGSVSRALQFVLEHCRADRFYLSPGYAWRHSFDAAKERRNRLMRRGYIGKRNPVA